MIGFRRVIPAPIVATLFVTTLFLGACSRTNRDTRIAQIGETKTTSDESNGLTSSIRNSHKPSQTENTEADSQGPSQSVATAPLAPEDNPTVEPADRLWLPTSFGPVIIDLVIQIDGQSIDQYFDQQIDRVMKAAAETESTWHSLFEHVADNPAKFGNAIAVNLQNSRDMIHRFDRNRNGTPDRNETARYLFHQTPSAAPFRLSGTDAFATATAADSPMFTRLDADSDGSVSDEELTNVTPALFYFDENSDERIDSDEVITNDIARTNAWQSKRSQRWATVAMDFRGPIDWTMVGYSINRSDQSGPFRRQENFLSAIDQDQNHSVTDIEAERLQVLPADARILIDYREQTVPHIELTDVGSHVSETRTETSPGKLVLRTDRFQLIFQAGALRQPTFWDCQVRARGAEVADPFFTFLDRNLDGFLSTREIVNAESLLRSIGVDSRLRSEHLPVSYQIRFVRGNPTADDQLYNARSVPRGGSDKRPRWAIAMDRNRDGDISRKEFLGNSSVFDSIDSNGDGFLDSVETKTELP